MTESTDVQMIVRNFSENKPESIIIFLQSFKAVCDAGNIHKAVLMWLFKHYLTDAMEAVINAHVTLARETQVESRVLNFVFRNHQLSTKRFATDESIETTDCTIKNFKQGSLTAANHAQQLWTKMLRYSLVYNENTIKTSL